MFLQGWTGLYEQSLYINENACVNLNEILYIGEGGGKGKKTEEKDVKNRDALLGFISRTISMNESWDSSIPEMADKESIYT